MFRSFFFQAEDGIRAHCVTGVQTCALPISSTSFTGRSPDQVKLVEAYMKEQGLFHSPDAPEPVYSDTLVLDLATVEASLAGPRRPQDRVPLRSVKQNFLTQLPTLVKPTSPIGPPSDVRNHWEAEGGQP